MTDQPERWSDWNEHATVLRDFMGCWHRSIGTGSIHSIERIEEAIGYFAEDGSLQRLVEDMNAQDKRIAELEAERDHLRRSLVAIQKVVRREALMEAAGIAVNVPTDEVFDEAHAAGVKDALSRYRHELRRMAEEQPNTQPEQPNEP